MKIITTEVIMTHNPCDDYPESRISELIGKGKTPLEILDLPIPSQDRIWVLTREEILSDQILHEFALLCEESVLHIYEDRHPGDRRPRNAIEAKRRWLRGEITDMELSEAADAAWATWAARAAALSAEEAEEAAWAARAAEGAARSAAWVARSARSAAWAARSAQAARAARAARAAEQEKQIEFFRGLLQKMS